MAHEIQLIVIGAIVTVILGGGVVHLAIELRRWQLNRRKRIKVQSTPPASHFVPAVEPEDMRAQTIELETATKSFQARKKFHPATH